MFFQAAFEKSVGFVSFVPLLPRRTVKLFGVAVSEKFPRAFTVNVMVVVAVRLADVPVTVTVAVPFFAVVLAVKVSTVEEVIGFELKEAVTPAGTPDATSVNVGAPTGKYN